MNKSRYIAIMAGGVGSRFWPSSTEQKPKQFLDILGIGKSLLQMTYERSLHLVSNQHILVVTNVNYASIVREQLPDLPVENIICEPSRNNTAPCIAYTALRINAENPLATFAVLSSDHIILHEDVFISKINAAFDFAENNDAIVTLSITPNRPDTGYGYIKYSNDGDVKKVISFKEKPDLETAKVYVASGEYAWNSGMFIWKVSTILEAFKKYAPDILEVLTKDITMYGHVNEQHYINEVYPNTENVSVDYAILEKADNVYTLTADIGWSDLGTWNSLYSYMEKNEGGNVVHAEKAFLIDVQNSIIRANGDKIVVVNGLEDYIIIDEEHALLIYPRNKEQEIKKIVKSLQ